MAKKPPVLTEITPEFAASALAHNNANRALSEVSVARLCKTIREGHWKVNGETIKFATDGTLLDGQHRLKAVVITGITIQSFVIHGLDPDTFDTIDIGKRRRGGDTLSIIGVKNANDVSAALMVLESYYRGTLPVIERFTNHEIITLYEQYRDISEYVYKMTGKKVLRQLIEPSVISACWYLFSRQDPAKADEFFERVHDGRELPQDSPILLLRERLIRNNGAKAKLPKQYKMAIIIKAWNAWWEGRPMGTLKWHDQEPREVFPVVSKRKMKAPVHVEQGNNGSVDTE